MPAFASVVYAGVMAETTTTQQQQLQETAPVEQQNEDWAGLQRVEQQAHRSAAPVAPDDSAEPHPQAAATTYIKDILASHSSEPAVRHKAASPAELEAGNRPVASQELKAALLAQASAAAFAKLRKSLAAQMKRPPTPLSKADAAAKLRAELATKFRAVAVRQPRAVVTAQIWEDAYGRLRKAVPAALLAL